LPEIPVPVTAAGAAARSASAIALVAPSTTVLGLGAPSATGTPWVEAGAPALLSQTHDKPLPSSPALDQRASALWAAIVRDDPGVAMPFFFPLDAYEQVKDVGDPAADWKHRLVSAYGRDIHALHAQLGDAAAARLVSLEVPDARARWVEPGEEWNKLGYFRVFGSKLRYEIDGDAAAIEIKSLISWRGEWYVVHLSAIQ